MPRKLASDDEVGMRMSDLLMVLVMRLVTSLMLIESGDELC